MWTLFRLMLRIAAILFPVLLVIAFFTNPDKSDFTDRVERIALEYAGLDSTSNVLEEEGVRMIRELTEELVTRENYYICSIFELRVPFGGKYRYLGVFGQFIPLQKANPLDEWQGMIPGFADDASREIPITTPQAGARASG